MFSSVQNCQFNYQMSAGLQQLRITAGVDWQVAASTCVPVQHVMLNNKQYVKQNAEQAEAELGWISHD